MRIGLTYDLRADYLAAGYSELETAEFDSEDTIAAIVTALHELGHETDRIGHLRKLMARLQAGDRWDLVFNLAEGLHGFGREAQIPCLLEAFQIPYTLSDSLSCALTLHKGMAKHVVRSQGVPTADFAVISELAEIDALQLPYPLFAKPVAEGTGKGVHPTSKVTHRDALRQVRAELLNKHQQPVLVETYLPGREFTVGIIGTGANARSIGGMEIILRASAEPGVYSFINKEDWQQRVDYQLLEEPRLRAAVETVALDAWRALGCRDAGRIDIRLAADGTPNFLEVNPLAGLHPGYSDLPIICQLQNIPYQQLISWILEAALSRYPRTPVADLACA